MGKPNPNMKLFRQARNVLIAATLVGAALSTVGATAAQAATPSSRAVSVEAPATPVQQTLSRQLLGLEPRSALAAPAHVVPLDHSGCNGYVCLAVHSSGGSGPNIIGWLTDAYSSTYTCAKANFNVNSTTMASSGYLCFTGDSPSVSAPSSLLKTYPVGTQLCNGWAAEAGYPLISGYPCATVE